MNWEMIGAIGQWAGAIGTILAVWVALGQTKQQRAQYTEQLISQQEQFKYQLHYQRELFEAQRERLEVLRGIQHSQNRIQLTLLLQSTLEDHWFIPVKLRYIGGQRAADIEDIYVSNNEIPLHNITYPILKQIYDERVIGYLDLRELFQFYQEKTKIDGELFTGHIFEICVVDELKEKHTFTLRVEYIDHSKKLIVRVRHNHYSFSIPE